MQKIQHPENFFQKKKQKKHFSIKIAYFCTLEIN